MEGRSHTRAGRIPDPAPDLADPLGDLAGVRSHSPAGALTQRLIILLSLVAVLASLSIGIPGASAQAPPPQTNPPYPPGDYEAETSWDLCRVTLEVQFNFDFEPCNSGADFRVGVEVSFTPGYLELELPHGRLGVNEIYKVTWSSGLVFYFDCLNVLYFRVNGCQTRQRIGEFGFTSLGGPDFFGTSLLILDLPSATLEVVDVVGDNVGCWYMYMGACSSQAYLDVNSEVLYTAIPFTPPTTTTLPGPRPDVTDANRCWVLNPDLDAPAFGDDLDLDGECDRDEDGDGIVDRDFTTGDVCSGLTDRQCELIDVEPELLGEPCDAEYNGHYDAWLNRLAEQRSQFHRWRHISYDGSAVVAGIVARDDFIGVELRSTFSGAGADCLLVVEIWEAQTGLQYDSRWSLFVPSVSDRVTPLLRDGDVSYSFCWQGTPTSCTGDISDFVCDTDIAVTLASGSYDVISCWGDISEFDWVTYLDLLPVVGAPHITLLPAYSADQGYYISEIVADFWQCFTSDTTAGYEFLDDGPDVYDRYTGAYSFASGGGGGGGLLGFLSGLPLVGRFVGSASDVISGIPCGLFEIVVSDASSIDRVVNGVNNCKSAVGSRDVFCTEFSLIGEHISVWNGVVNGTIPCDGVELAIFQHDIFRRLSASDDRIDVNPFDVCPPDRDAPNERPGILFTAGNIFRPWLSAAVVIVLLYFVLRMMRRFFGV